MTHRPTFGQTHTSKKILERFSQCNRPIMFIYWQLSASMLLASVKDCDWCANIASVPKHPRIKGGNKPKTDGYHVKTDSRTRQFQIYLEPRASILLLHRFIWPEQQPNTYAFKATSIWRRELRQRTRSGVLLRSSSCVILSRADQDMTWFQARFVIVLYVFFVC